MKYLGLGKTLFNSSACLFSPGKEGRKPSIELVLSERLLRKKATGVWPDNAIRALGLSPGEELEIAENRDVHAPEHQEDVLDRGFPFYAFLEREGLGRFSRKFNPKVDFLTHHRCHAMAAVAMSPFEKSLIVVMDGAGSLRKDFVSEQARSELLGDPCADSHEECSVYLHDRGRLQPVYKRWKVFRQSKLYPKHAWSDGPGILYEKVSEYIFNSGRAAGKVMGLASFGKASRIGERLEFLEALDWKNAFGGKSKKDWEGSGRFEAWADLAASVQADFETQLFTLLEQLCHEYPDYSKIILTGGCALNCSANGRLLAIGLFDEIYVPPFPGDESIGFGAASYLYHGKDRNPWQPLLHEEQHGYFGPASSAPNERTVDQAFAGCAIVRPESITAHTAKLLSQGRILGWFQGRSESGPRALGNRSILADPRLPGLKDRMNRDVKFREAFRPYGASCIHGSAREYFDVPAGFNAPYMSFAVRPKAAYQELLKEVCHVDGTSRIQTVRPGQNPRFHELIETFAGLTGLPCLLNTSLNVMGEPIVETVQDARNFLEKTPVDGIVVGDHYIRRRR